MQQSDEAGPGTRVADLASDDARYQLSTHRDFTRAQWSRLRENTPLSLSADDLDRLRGLTSPLSLEDVTEVLLPLTRLLNLQVVASQGFKAVKEAFLGGDQYRAPFIIAIAGSVAVGKSTFARVLQAMLSHWPDHPQVELVTTDGFLYPTRVLEERGLMSKKGFPESYDLAKMIAFLTEVKSGAAEVSAPIYSHQIYDRVPGKLQTIRRPDILIFEGLNVLQTAEGASLLASDFFDFSVYIDADESHIESWYVERFLTLQKTAFQDPASYFHHYRDLTKDEGIDIAKRIWSEINAVNLVKNILPTRERASIVLRKAADHSVDEIRLRRI